MQCSGNPVCGAGPKTADASWQADFGQIGSSCLPNSMLAGVVDLGMVSREVYPPEEAKGAVGFAVAKDAVAATVNAANPKIFE